MLQRHEKTLVNTRLFAVNARPLSVYGTAFYAIMEILDAYGTITFNFDNIFSKDISCILCTFEACRLQSFPGTVSKYLKPVFMRERKKVMIKEDIHVGGESPVALSQCNKFMLYIMPSLMLLAMQARSIKLGTIYNIDLLHCEQVLEIYRKTEDWPASFAEKEN